MKLKYFSIFLMIWIFSFVIQPIYSEPTETQMHKTKVEVWSKDPSHDMNFPVSVHGGSTIAISAKLSELDENLGSYKPLEWRYLNFYVYRANDDGSNSRLVYQDRQLTGLLICDTVTSLVLGWGDYNVIVTYEGNYEDHLESSSATMKIHAF